METTKDKTTDNCPAAPFNIDKSLVPINQYAQKEGVSKKTIEQCGKLGIVQIRKFKGQTYVVDSPLTPYIQKCSPIVTKENDWQRKKIVDLIKKMLPKTTGNGPITTSEILEIINEQNSQIFENSSVNSENSENAENTNTLIEPTAEKLIQKKTDKHKVTSKKLVVALSVLLTAVLASFGFTAYRFYQVREMQLDIIRIYGQNTEKMLVASKNTSQKVRSLQNQLTTAQKEVKNLKKQLNDSQIMLEITKQQYNQKVERISSQLQKLTSP